MAVFTDDFNRANGGLGANWVAVESTLAIATNKVTVGSGLNGLSRTVSVFSGADQSASLDISSFFQAGNNVGVCVRFDASACYLFAVRNSTTPTYRLFQYAGASSFTLLGTAVNATVPTLPATITCEIIGNVLTGKVNGVAVIAHTLSSDPLSANRKGGIYVADQSTADNFTMDNIAATDTIALTLPQPNQIIQRTGTTFAGGTASITISGTYVGTPTSIEARFAGGTWATIVASPTGGTFAGTLSEQAAGQGAVEVRFTNNTAITASAADVGIGEVFAAFGQSNAVCLATNPQSWSAPAAYTHYKPGVRKYNGSAWGLMADPVFNTTEETAAVGKGSCYPRLATLLMKQLGVPVGFITVGKGTTGLIGGSESPKLNHWNKTGTGVNAHTQYDKAVATANSAGINAARGILWYQGEADTLGTGAGDNAGRAAYAAAVSVLLDNLQGDCASLASAKMICATLAEYSSNASTSSSDLTAIRMAQIDAIDSDADVYLGPVGFEQDFSDNAHWTTDPQITRLGNLWYCSIMSAFFSGTEGYSPRIVSATTSGATITLTYDRDLLASDSAYGVGAFFATDNTGTLTISSAARSGIRTVLLTCSRTVDINCQVSLGRGTTAAGLTVPRSADVTLPDSTAVNLVAAPFELYVTTSGALQTVTLQSTPGLTGHSIRLKTSSGTTLATQSATELSTGVYGATFTGLAAGFAFLQFVRDSDSTIVAFGNVTLTSDTATFPVSGGGSAVLDSADQSDEILDAVTATNARLDTIAAKTNLINAGRLRVLSRVAGNVITAHAGDDHLILAENALPLEVDDDDASLYALLTDAGNLNVKFGAGRASDTDADEISATIPAANVRHVGTSTFVDIELPSAATAGRRGEYEFDIQITNAAGYKITPQQLQGTLMIEVDRRS